MNVVSSLVIVRELVLDFKWITCYLIEGKFKFHTLQL
jgi:hypothetical protein